MITTHQDQSLTPIIQGEILKAAKALVRQTRAIEFISAEEVAKILNVCPDTIRRHINRGLYAGTMPKKGKRMYVNVKSLNQYLTSISYEPPI